MSLILQLIFVILKNGIFLFCNFHKTKAIMKPKCLAMDSSLLSPIPCFCRPFHAYTPKLLTILGNENVNCVLNFIVFTRFFLHHKN